MSSAAATGAYPCGIAKNAKNAKNAKVSGARLVARSWPRHRACRRKRNISYEEFHPYGTTAWWTDPGSTVSQKRYRYTGKEKDEESGLYYHGARYYAPWLARWQTTDPSQMSDGVNRYAYVSGNPIKLSDPTGNGGWLGVYNSTPEPGPDASLSERASTAFWTGLPTVGMQADAAVEWSVGAVKTAAANAPIGAKAIVTDPIGTGAFVAGKAATGAKDVLLSTPTGKYMSALVNDDPDAAMAATLEPALVAGAVGSEIVGATMWGAKVEETLIHVVTGSPSPGRELRAAVINETPLQAVTGPVDLTLKGTAADATLSTETAAAIAVPAYLASGAPAVATTRVGVHLQARTIGIGELVFGDATLDATIVDAGRTLSVGIADTPSMLRGGGRLGVLYGGILKAAGPQVETIYSTMAGTNLQLIEAQGLAASPTFRVRARYGFTDQAFDDQAYTLVSRKPPPSVGDN